MKMLCSPQQPVSSCTGQSHPAGCSPAGTASTGRSWMRASGQDKSSSFWTLCRWLCLYVEEHNVKCVCVSAFTHSIKDLKLLLCLEDVDLQRKRQTCFLINIIKLCGVFIVFKYFPQLQTPFDTKRLLRQLPLVDSILFSLNVTPSAFIWVNSDKDKPSWVSVRVNRRSRKNFTRSHKETTPAAFQGLKPLHCAVYWNWCKP